MTTGSSPRRQRVPPCGPRRPAHRWAGAGVRPSDRVEFAWCGYCKAVRWRKRGTENWRYDEPPTRPAVERAKMEADAKSGAAKPEGKPS